MELAYRIVICTFLILMGLAFFLSTLVVIAHQLRLIKRLRAIIKIRRRKAGMISDYNSARSRSPMSISGR